MHNVIDDAIHVAAARARAAQDVVADEIKAAGVPDVQDVELVRRRAEDLGTLAHERAADATKADDKAAPA